jgi:carbon monoxide dehydrogenase subunit G
MEVKVDKEYPVEASPDAAWSVLSDIRALASCMPGAEIVEQIDDNRYKGNIKVKVGPVTASFAGEITVLQVDSAGKSLQLIGKGADKGGSSASMELTATLKPAAPGQAVLLGHADVVVNGKFAQMGSRMLLPVSDMVLAQFATAFSSKAKAVVAQAAPALAAEAATPPAADQAPTALNGLQIVWVVIKSFFAQILGRRVQN